MYKRQGKPKEIRSHLEQESFTNTSIQHLYQLLGKNLKEAFTEPRHLLSIDRRYFVQNPAERLKVNMKYSPKSHDNVESFEETVVNKACILQGFAKRAKKFNSQEKKKTFSVQDTNSKLKSIILGKKQDKKVRFFEGANDIEANRPNNTSMFDRIDNTIQSKPRVINTQANRQTTRRYETQIMEKIEIPQQIDLNDHFQKFKQSLKLKPIESYIKRTRNNKFTIMGLSVKKYKQANLQDNNGVKELPEELPTQQLELAIINKEEPKQHTNWKIQSIPLMISDKKPKFSSTNSTKIKNKSSFQALVTKCLPYLSISQHILWKLEEMIRFYSLVLLSFQSFILSPEPNDLPKFSRKCVKYSYYIGGGNNRYLIAQLMQKRWWWKETNNITQANLIWTQQKIKTSHRKSSHHVDDFTEKSLLIFAKAEKQRQQRLKKKWKQAKENHSYSNLFSSFQCTVPQTCEADQFKLVVPPSILKNHMAGGKHLGNKKSLFLMLKLWFQGYQKKPQELFSFIPQTLHIISKESRQFSSFESKFNSFQATDKFNNLWIVKPGENSNRGRGIFLSSFLNQITESIVTRAQQGGTTIIQRYLSNLLLYNGRKFDIRTYLLCITIGSNCKYYWFSQGYLRTSSQLYSLKEFSTMTHLTNDAIQNQGDQYGKYEKGNKLSYQQFQHYLDENHSNMGWKMSDLLKKMKQIAKKIATISYPIINFEQSTCFQLFGMDFLIDSSFKPWLLEVNTNPCLQQSSPLLQKLIPHVVQNVLRLSVDTLFPPNILPNKQSQYTLPDKMMEWNKFQLIFDIKLQRQEGWQRLLTQRWPSEKEHLESLKIETQ